MGMILRIASSRIVGQGDIVGRSGYFSLNLSANSVMRGRLDARRTLKSLVADLRFTTCCTHSALQPSGTYFAAKVSGRHNPANAGIPLGRENLPLRCRAYFPVRALSGCFLPPFRCRKITPTVAHRASRGKETN